MKLKVWPSYSATRRYLQIMHRLDIVTWNSFWVGETASWNLTEVDLYLEKFV